MKPEPDALETPSETATRPTTRSEPKPRPLKRPDPNRWTIHVMPHTRWDLEESLTAEELRPRLMALVDRLVTLMEPPGRLRSFLFDGQTAAMEEYLESRPEMERRLAALVATGRLVVGPATTQPDFFLASGEAIVRNLLHAKRLERRLGPAGTTAYFASSFGLPAQTPQILAGFGIDACVFWRGHGGSEEPAEFRWIAPDGRSEVLAIKLDDEHGYALGHAFPEESENARLRLAEILAARIPHATGSHILLPCGDDHSEPPAHLIRSLKAAAAALGERPRVRLVWSKPAAFARSVRRGRPSMAVQRDNEFRSGRETPVFAGVLSARGPVKILNFEAETSLFRLAEPAALLAARFGLPYPAERLARAVRLLLLNQAESSLAGACSDKTCGDIEQRYRWISEIVEPVIHESLAHLAGAVRMRESMEEVLAPEGAYEKPAVRVLVFNPSPWTRTDRVFAAIEFPASIEAEGVSLSAENGSAVEVAVHDVERGMTAIHAYPALPLREEKVDRFHVSFLARELPALGYALWTAAPRGTAVPVAEEAQALALGQRRPPSGNGSSRSGLRIEGHQMENEHLAAQWETDGTLTVTHKASGRVFRGMNRLVDSGDAGDILTYAPPPVDRAVESSAARMALSGELLSHDLAVLRATFDMPIPRCLSANRSRRATATVPCFTRVEAYLSRGSSRLDVRVMFENGAEDHRLRALFPSGAPAASSIADGAFDVRRRPAAAPESPEDWAEFPAGTHPFKNFFGVLIEGGGFLVGAKGLAEYEADPGGTLALTLLRSVGWLSRSDTGRRRAKGMASLRTAAAQCVGFHVFEYTLVPFSGDAAHAIREVLAHNQPPRSYAAADGAVPETDVAFPRSHEFRFAPSRTPFVALEPAALAVSALKAAEDGRGSILRVFNYSRRDLPGRLTFGFDVESAERVDLAERTLEKISVRGREMEFLAPGRGIVTFRVKWAGA